MNPATPIVITASALTSSLTFAQLPTPGIAQSTKDEHGVTETKNLISMPKHADDFIRNIKYSFDRNLFLNEEFFEKNSVCKIFSIDERSCNPRKTNKPDGTHEISLYAGEFAGVFDEQDIKQIDSFQDGHSTHSSSIANAQISIYQEVNSLGTVSGGIAFFLREGGPDFNEIVQLLNTNLSQIIEMPPHGKIPIPITGAHGDETWGYKTSDEKFKKKLIVSFHEDGSLRALRVEVEEVGGHQ